MSENLINVLYALVEFCETALETAQEKDNSNDKNSKILEDVRNLSDRLHNKDVDSLKESDFLTIYVGLTTLTPFLSNKIKELEKTVSTYNSMKQIIREELTQEQGTNMQILIDKLEKSIS